MKSIDSLIEGSKKFKTLYFKNNQQKFKDLVKNGQSPKTLFIGCADSRVMPNLITDTKEGDLFILRNVGNFIPPYSPDNEYHGTATGIEYAVKHLKVENIIVCGHSYCGACASLYMEHSDDTPHIKQWLKLGDKTKKDVKELIANKPYITNDEMLRLTERISLINQLENLLTYSYVKDGLDKGLIDIHGWYYKLGKGDIEYYDAEEKVFKAL